MNITQTENIPQGLEIRYTISSDAEYLKSWLMDPETSCWFPMYDEMEIEDAVIRWIAFSRYHCSLTITKDGVPCGIATLYLQPYRRLAHQCEFGIVVDKKYRNLKIGSYLMSSLIDLAKNRFKIELMHLQVYENNPAINFYTRFGFKEFGRQNHWAKEEKRYAGRIFMERFI